MTEEQNALNREENNRQSTPPVEDHSPAAAASAESTAADDPLDAPDGAEHSADLDERLERLGGEPAPAITPEEFARLQRAGQVHIDSRGRIRTARPGDAEGGVSLRKRRAWYA